MMLPEKSDQITKDTIRKLQTAMSKLPQKEFKTEHHFADGMYCRSLEQPAGSVVVGKLHLKEHFLMLIKGELTIWLEGGMRHIKAPFIWVSKPGTKRAIYAHEDSVYVNVHRTALTDIDEIEHELIEPDETSLFDAHNKPIVERLEHK